MTLLSDAPDARSGPSRPRGDRRDALPSGASPPELPVGIFYKGAFRRSGSLRPPPRLFRGANCRYSLQGDPARAAFRLLRRVWPTDDYHQQFMKFTTDGRLLQTIGVKGQRSDTGLPENDLSSAASNR